MTGQRLDELMNAGLDGELGEADAAELRQLLAASETARNQQAGLQGLVKLIEGLPPLEPPSRLRGTILENISLPRKSSRAFSLRESPALVRYGLAFAAGLFMMVSIYQLGPRGVSPEDLSRMTGTVGTAPGTAPITVLDQFSLDLEDLSGTVDLQSSEDVLVVEFDLRASKALEVRVNFPQQSLVFGGIAQIDNNLEAAEVTPGRIRVNTLGDQQFAVYLREQGQDRGGEPLRIEVAFTSGGTVLHAGELTTQ